MSYLVVGGDHLGSIINNLKKFGATKVTHVTGRKRRDLNFHFRDDVDIVIVLTDYISHGLAEKIKTDAKVTGKKIFFTRRSWAHIEEMLNVIK
jgi:hypothetical protein